MGNEDKRLKLAYTAPKKPEKPRKPQKAAPAKKHREKKTEKPKKQTARQKEQPVEAGPPVKDFLDLIVPGAAEFQTDHYILGSAYRSAFALRGYPSSTEELALLQHLGDKCGVTLSVYIREMPPTEERRIIHEATR